MNIIKVNPFSVNTRGEYDYFGDETGTPEYYMVLHTLEKHLGKENILVGWDYTEFFFEIEIIEDEGCYCDNTIDYIQCIESIFEPFEPYNFVYMKNDNLVFQVLYDD
jgi:hypothetical protein